MRWHGCWVAAAILVAGGQALALSPYRVTRSADVYWDANSARLLRSQQQHVERIACVARQVNVEAVIAVGHAGSEERQPQRLSRQRADAVKAMLVAGGVSPERVHVEGKGAVQPVSRDATANRRVEIELVGTPKPGGGPPDDCSPAWKRQMLALSSDEALAMLRSRIREGWLVPGEVLVHAVQSGRHDLLAALLPAGIAAVSQRDRTAALTAATSNLDATALRLLLRSGMRLRDAGEPGLFLAWSVCWGKGPSAADEQVLEIMRVLLEAGARPDAHSHAPGSPLGCAARSGKLAVVDFLLGAGAHPDEPRTSPPLLAAGPHPEVVARLLKAGADPKARNSAGETLFHTYKLRQPADVQFLMSLGLSPEAAGDGRTPLHVAAEYARPDVLRALKEAMGGWGEPSQMARLYAAALRNPEARAWLIDEGIPLPDPGAALLREAGSGAAGMPALQALLRRGVPAQQWDAYGMSALAHAIQQLSPELVQILLDAGADPARVTRYPTRADSALEFARSLSLERRPGPCIHCSESWYRSRNAELNAPEAIARRRELRDAVIRILETAQGSR